MAKPNLFTRLSLVLKLSSGVSRRYTNALTRQANVESRRAAAEARKLVEEGAKLTQDRAKSQADTRKTWLEAARLGVTSFVVVYGIVAVFCYCFFAAHFFPSGVTTGDTLLFAFVALALGIAGLVFSGMGTMAYVPWFYPVKVRNDGESQQISKPSITLASWCYAVAVLVAPVLAWYFVWSQPDLSKSLGTWPFWLKLLPFVVQLGCAIFLMHRRGVALGEGALFAMTTVVSSMGASILFTQPGGWAGVAACLVGGAAMSVALASLDDSFYAKQPSGGHAATASRARGRNVAMAFGTVAFFAPVIVVSAYAPEDSKVGIASYIFSQLGIAADDAAAQLSDENLHTLAGAAALEDAMLSVCRESNGVAIVTGLKVWWYGIGNRSHVELPGRGAPTAKGIRADLTTSGVKLIRNYKTRCLEIPDVFFESGKNTLLNEDSLVRLRAAIDAEVARPDSQGRTLARIDVIGHADPMPAIALTNEKLALDRASAVAIQLRLLPSVQSFLSGGPRSEEKIRIVSFGARKPVVLCKPDGSAAIQRECNAVNRRVELRLHFRTLPKGPFVHDAENPA